MDYSERLTRLLERTGLQARFHTALLILNDLSDSTSQQFSLAIFLTKIAHAIPLVVARALLVVLCTALKETQREDTIFWSDPVILNL